MQPGSLKHPPPTSPVSPGAGVDSTPKQCLNNPLQPPPGGCCPENRDCPEGTESSEGRIARPNEQDVGQGVS